MVSFMRAILPSFSLALCILLLFIMVFPADAQNEQLEFGVPVKGNFTMYGEVHSYSFDANAGDTVLISLTWGGPGNTWASLELYSPTGAMLNSSKGPTARATSKLPVTGLYTVSAGTTGPAWGSWGPGPYVLTVQRVAYGTPPTLPPTGGQTPATTQSISVTPTGPGPAPVSPTPQDSAPLFLITGGILAAAVLAAVGVYTYRNRSRFLKPGTGAPQSVRGTVPGSGVIGHDVFISYASEDKPVADAICNRLESERIRCWITPRDILPGTKYQEAIIDAIDTSAIMVLVFSSHSNTSPHVLSEVTEAMSKEVIIIPFRIEDVLPSKAMKYLIGVPHWLDAITPPLERHIDELGKTIRVILKQRSEPASSNQ